MNDSKKKQLELWKKSQESYLHRKEILIDELELGIEYVKSLIKINIKKLEEFQESLELEKNSYQHDLKVFHNWKNENKID